MTDSEIRRWAERLAFLRPIKDEGEKLQETLGDAFICDMARAVCSMLQNEKVDESTPGGKFLSKTISEIENFSHAKEEFNVLIWHVLMFFGETETRKRHEAFDRAQKENPGLFHISNGDEKP